MSYTRREMAMPGGQYAIKCPYSMKPEFIVIHNTANDASAENEIRYMQANGNQVSFHFAVDDKEVVQGVPLDRNTWHAGDGGNGKGNRKGISIEICYSKSGGDRFLKAEENAAAFTASLLDEYGWGIDKVMKHQDFSGKRCPHRTLDMGWDRFLAMVEKYRTKTVAASTPAKATSYEKNGLTFIRADNFSVRYHDKSKRVGNYNRYANGGFFAVYKNSAGAYFTLPVGNLVCDIDVIPAVGQKYLTPFVSDGKLRYDCNDNQSAQFHGKAVSTLVVPTVGKPYIADLAAPPANAKYAISGVPTVRNGDDVDYHRYVRAQGFDTSCMYGTWRSWLGVRNGEIWFITGKTVTANYIYGMEFWKKVKDEGFDDIICIDGGGSYYWKNGKAIKTTSGARQINNVVVF